MTVVLQRREQKHPGGGQSCENRGRDYSAIAGKPRMPRKACKHLQTLPRGRKHSPYRLSLGSMAPLSTWFQTSGLQNSERTNFCCFWLIRYGTSGFFGSLRKWIQCSFWLSLPWKADTQRKTLYVGTLYSIFETQVFSSRDSRSAHRNEVQAGPPSPQWNRSAESTFITIGSGTGRHTPLLQPVGPIAVYFPPGIFLPSPLLLLRALQILEAQFKLIFLQETCLDWTRHSSSAFLFYHNLYLCA